MIEVVGVVGLAVAVGATVLAWLARREARGARDWAVAMSDGMTRRVNSVAEEVSVLRRDIAEAALGVRQALERPVTSAGDLEAVRRDLKAALAPIQERLFALEERLAAIQQRIESSPPRAAGPAGPLPGGPDPLAALARRIARLTSPPAGRPTTAVTPGPALDPSRVASQGASVDGGGEAPEGTKVPTGGGDVSALARQIAHHARGLVSRARPIAAGADGLPEALARLVREIVHALDARRGDPGGEPDPPTIEEFVKDHASRDAAWRPVELLAAYVEAARGPAKVGPPVATAEEVVERAVEWVDRIYDVRGRADEEARRPAVREATDELLAGIKELLRGFGVALVATEASGPLEVEACRVLGSVDRPDLPDNTVVRVLRPGLRSAGTGRLLRPAEVVVSTRG